jgi:general stress protein 26
MNESDAKARVREILEKPGRVVVFATVDGEGRPKCRYMTSLTLDDENVIYMVTSSKGRKVEQVLHNPLCQICAWTEQWEETVELDGRAEIVDSPGTRGYVWERHPVLANYFEGPDSENYALIKVTVETGEYIHVHKKGMPVSLTY